MIYIYSENIQQLAHKWYALLKRYVKDENYSQQMSDAVEQSDLSVEDKAVAKMVIKRYFKHLPYYVLAGQDELTYIKQIYASTIGRKKKIKRNEKRIHEALHNYLQKAFSQLYSNFTQSTPHFEEGDEDADNYKEHKISYYFFEKFNLRTCPYCNRNYTFTIFKKGHMIRPEYDHFYGKADYPLLAVSFFNLIPSCHTCNYLKRTSPIGINPYFGRFESKFEVHKKDSNLPLLAEKELSQDQLLIEFDSPSKAEQLNIENLGLGDLYKMHADYAMELIEKARIYRGPMMEDLASTFQTAEYTPQQVYEFVWGKNLEDANHINRPLSKLTKDILDQLDIH